MDSSLEGLIERQENEFIALQAIYGDDFKEEPHPLPKKQGPWAILPAIPRKSRCRISLKGFDLVVELPLRYPEQAPAIRLQRCDPVIRRSLESVVDVKVKELAGKEMIWEVASAVSEYVESHASQLAPSKAQENGETASRELVSNRSSYDLMQKRISEEAEILLQEQKLREERERKRREEEKLAEYNDLYKKVEEELQRKNAAHNPQVVASLMSPVTAGLDSPDNVDSASHNTPQRNGEKPSPEETFHEVELHSVPLDGGGNPSRYLNDFEEINFIGKGGFGQVLKARNRLDGRLYAIKKVLLEPGENATVLREVRALSRLSSPRTVRYYQAWTELLEAASPPDTGSELSEDPESSESSGIVFGNERSVSKISKGTDSACEKFEHLRVTDDSFDDDEEDYDGNAGNPLTPKDWLTVGGRSESFIDVRFDFKRPRTVPDSPPMGNVNQAAARSGSSDTTSPSEEETKTKQAERVLYIQMEFCGDKTLRDIIDSRPLTEQESWLYLRQILEGLAHIHQQGLIHRDLKPQNIFVDDEGNLKIGDFGLATANLQEREVFASVFRSAEDLTARAQTFDIGTALYVAPELRGKQTIKYNHKVDMYSLGIVFFETLYRFSTGMERIVCLQALRQDPISFPADLDHDRLSSQVEIIRSLLSHNPKQRPSAKKLLRSDKLPLSLGLTHLNEALRALTDAKTTYYPMLIKLLFQKNMDMYKDFAYDMDTQNPNSELGNCALYAKLREHMTSIFNRHGAIELNTPLLMLSVGTQPASVKLLDNHGDMVNLPFDLTTPFARYIARSEIIQIKRYSFGTVFRDNPGGGHPREAREVDFDIINSPKTPSGMMEAELITVIDQVLSGFPPTAKRGYHIHFNDMRLLEVIFDICDIRMDPRVLALLENTGRGFSWNQIRHNLINHFGVSKRNVDLLSRFKVEGLLGDLVESLQDVFPISPRVQQVLSELQLIIRYTKDFRTAIKMHWFPLLVHNPNVYSGSFVFQAALNRDIGGTKVLAAGGRYDTLLQKFYHPVLGKKRRGPNVDKRKAVGVHLAIEKFLVMLNEDLNDALQKPTSNSHANSLSGIKESTEAMLLRQWEPRVVEVFVTSFGKGLLEKRLSVIRELWQSGIRAEVLYDTDAVTLDKVISLCTYLGVLFVVLVKKSVVKVKDLRSKHEVEVPFQDLAQWLHRELEEYRGLAPRVAVRGSGLEICDGDGESDDAGQVTVIWDDTESENKKARKQRKGDVSGRAQACVAEAVSRLRKSPTLALSVPKSIVLALSAVNVRHDESFRKLLDAHPIHRRVLQNARSRMLEMLREEGVRFCFLYSNVHDWVEVYHFQDAFGGGGHGKNPVTSS